MQDGEVPRDAEYERARAYMMRRCRYAATLLMNQQLPEQDAGPEEVLNILQGWSNTQLELFFLDLVNALNQARLRSTQPSRRCGQLCCCLGPRLSAAAPLPSVRSFAGPVRRPPAWLHRAGPRVWADAALRCGALAAPERASADQRHLQREPEPPLHRQQHLEPARL